MEPDLTLNIALLWVGLAERRFLPICLFPVSLRSTFFINQIALAVVLNYVWNSSLLKQIPNHIVHMLPTQTLFLFSSPDNEILYLRAVGKQRTVKSSCWLNCYSRSSFCAKMFLMFCEVGRRLLWQQGYLAKYNLTELEEEEVWQEYQKVQKGQNLSLGCTFSV